MDTKKRSSEKVLIWVFVIVILVILGFIGKSLWLKRIVPQIDPNTYQAVFLDNGQQYFGHLMNVGSRHPYLTDVYYINAQPKDPENPAAEPKFQLVKRGNEIHGPQDAMYLNKEHILFWENLRPDSKVVNGIYQEKAQRAAGINAQQNAQPFPVPGPATAPVVK